MSENYKVLGACFDKVSKTRVMVEKIKFNHGEIHRDKERMTRTIHSLRMEMDKLTEYDSQLTEENMELLRRLSFFEEENRQMANTNKKIEAFKDEALQRTEQAQLKLIKKVKECENLAREKADLESKVRLLTAKAGLENISNSDRQEAMESEALVSLEQAQNKLLLYKENLINQRKEVEKISIKCNKLESELKSMSMDYEIERENNKSLKDEMKVLKERVGAAESQKREAINNLGVSKLGFSNLNFSKYFGPGEKEEGGLLAKGYKPMQPDSSNVSVLNQTPKPTTETKNKIVFLTTEDKSQTPASKDSNTNPFTPTIGKLNLGAITNGKGVEPTARFFFQDGDLDTKDNPYLDDNSSVLPKFQSSVMRVRESRVSHMLVALGGQRSEFEFDQKQDFMGMSNQSSVRKEIERLGDTTMDSQKCYSDSIFLFDKTFKKNRCIVLVTPYSITFFNTKKTKLLKFYLLKSLQGITISAENFTLSVLHFEKQPDLLAESYRRLELISYINQMLHLSNLPKFNLTVRKKFIIKSDTKQQVPEKLEVTDPNLKINLTFLQDTIRNAKKSGYLNKIKSHWYGTNSTEYFCLLSNIGIILFKKYGVSFGVILGKKPCWFPANPGFESSKGRRERREEISENILHSIWRVKCYFFSGFSNRSLGVDEGNQGNSIRFKKLWRYSKGNPKFCSKIMKPKWDCFLILSQQKM